MNAAAMIHTDAELAALDGAIAGSSSTSVEPGSGGSTVDRRRAAGSAAAARPPAIARAGRSRDLARSLAGQLGE